MTETWMLVAGLAACVAAVAVVLVAALRAQPGLSKDRRTPARGRDVLVLPARGP